MTNTLQPNPVWNATYNFLQSYVFLFGFLFVSSLVPGVSTNSINSCVELLFYIAPAALYVFYTDEIEADEYYDEI